MFLILLLDWNEAFDKYFHNQYVWAVEMVSR